MMVGVRPRKVETGYWNVHVRPLLRRQHRGPFVFFLFLIRILELMQHHLVFLRRRVQNLTEHLDALTALYQKRYRHHVAFAISTMLGIMASLFTSLMGRLVSWTQYTPTSRRSSSLPRHFANISDGIGPPSCHSGNARTRPGVCNSTTCARGAACDQQVYLEHAVGADHLVVVVSVRAAGKLRLFQDGASVLQTTEPHEPFRVGFLRAFVHVLKVELPYVVSQDDVHALAL